MGKIKQLGQSQQCRCCLKEIGLKELWTEYYNGDEREVYGEMVNDCFALPWEPLFGKMEHICDSCISRLRDAVTFKKEILCSNQLLNEQAKNASVKQEDESDMEVETEYLSIDFLDSDKDKSLLEIKIEQESKAELTVKEEASPSKRGKRYTEDDFKKCIEAVKNGTMSQTKASIVYHVPRKCISAALANPQKEEEKAISKHHDNITTILKYTNATPIGTQNDKGYGCYFCEVFYEKPQELKEHTKDSHSADFERIMEDKTLSDYLMKLDITGLQCNICNSKILYTTPSLEDMMPHLKDHKKDIHMDIKNQIMPFNLKDGEIKCTICQQEFDEFETLIEHMHQHNRNHVCKNCPAGFINEKSYQDHIVSHQKGAFKCKDCDKIFDTLYKKKLHEASHVQSQSPSKCDICKKIFSLKRNRERHMASVHGKKLREIAARIARKCVRNRKR